MINSTNCRSTYGFFVCLGLCLVYVSNVYYVRGKRKIRSCVGVFCEQLSLVKLRSKRLFLRNYYFTVNWKQTIWRDMSIEIRWNKTIQTAWFCRKKVSSSTIKFKSKNIFLGKILILVTIMLNCVSCSNTPMHWHESWQKLKLLVLFRLEF